MNIRIQFAVTKGDFNRVIVDKILTNGLAADQISEKDVMAEVRRRYWDGGYSWKEGWEEARCYNNSDLAEALLVADGIIKSWGYE